MTKKEKEEILLDANNKATAYFNALPFETRKQLANPESALREINRLIELGDRLNMAALKERRAQLEEWMLDWYNENK